MAFRRDREGGGRESAPVNGGRAGDTGLGIPFWIVAGVALAAAGAMCLVPVGETIGSAGFGAPYYRDDADFAAYFQRIWNGELGRVAGVAAEPRYVGPVRFRELRSDTNAVLADRYFLEYPHAAQWLLGLAGAGVVFHRAHPVLLDGHYGDLAHYTPFPGEMWVRDAFRRMAAIWRFAMAFGLIGLAAILRKGWSVSWALLVLCLPGMVYFTVHRFDVIPVVLVAASLVLLARERVVGSAVCLATAAAVKVFPVLLTPVVAAYLWRRSRGAALRWGAVVACGVGGCFLLTVGLVGWESAIAPYMYQLGRAPEFGRIPYGPPTYLLPASLAGGGWGAAFRWGLVALVFARSLWRPVRDMLDLVRVGAAVVVLFAATQVFFSPQWNLWLTPFLIPLMRGAPWIAVVVVALDAVTFAMFPGFPGVDMMRPEFLAVRTGLLAGLGAWLALSGLGKGKVVPAVGLEPTTCGL